MASSSLKNIEEKILKRWHKNNQGPVVSKNHVEELTELTTAPYKTDEPLAQHTTFRVGGPCPLFLMPQNDEDLKKIIDYCLEKQLPFYFWGNGSNILVRDGGIDGIVIHTKAFNDIKAKPLDSENQNEWQLQASSGVRLNKLVSFCAQNQLTGLEPWVGIPGTVGGAVVMNAGARGVFVNDVLIDIKLWDKNLKTKTYPLDKLGFGYRTSKLPPYAFVLEACFKVTKNTQLNLEDEIKKYQKLRADTQPLNFPNLGSVFKNHINPESQKVYHAAKLIEEAGLKGVRVGGARISEKHSNFIVNENKATAKDVLALVSLIKDKVWETSGIRLHLEAKVLGKEE